MFDTSPRVSLRSLIIVTVTGGLLLSHAQAHEHHDEDIPAGEYVSADPLDRILWAHIMVQILAWGILFPTGMVFGIIRSRWHVPVQVTGTALAGLGYWLGHHHKGRQFSSHNAHASFAPILGLVLAGQVILGIYLKLHIERGFLGKIRAWLVIAHGVSGKALPVMAWVQMLFGGIVALGFCMGDHLGQCAAHFIMGSAFIGYGIVLTILLLVGQLWLRRTGRSQEFFDSIVIAAWGCVNTFTEHRWGGPWVRNDLQHTSMGVVWWCAGLLGIWLSRKRDGTPKRNLIPGIVILLTGYGMSAHPQELMLSTMIHAAFGWTLMAAGAARIVEISFVLRDKPCLGADGYDPNSFQYLPPFLLYASGFLFMGATEEQMSLLAGAGVTHVSYILILYSIAFILFLFVNVLVHIYAVHAFPALTPSTRSISGTARRPRHFQSSESNRMDDIEMDGELATKKAAVHSNGSVHVNGNSNGNGNGNANGDVMGERERRRVADAQEFELDALISDDEDDGRVKEGMKLR